MKRLKINTLGLCETRWKSAGINTPENYQIIDSEGENHQRDIAVVMDQERTNIIKGYWAVGQRVLLVKIKCRFQEPGYVVGPN